MTFLQRTFTSLVHAHAGRTQGAQKRLFGAGTQTWRGFAIFAPHLRPLAWRWYDSPRQVKRNTFAWSCKPILLSQINWVYASSEASKFVGCPAGICGLFIFRWTASTLLIPSWHLSSVYVRGLIMHEHYCHPNALGGCATADTWPNALTQTLLSCRYPW